MGAGPTDRTVLVTGAAGRIGRLFTRLCSTDLSLRLTDRPSADLSSLSRYGDVRPADLADEAAAGKLCHGVQVVVHLAGQSSPRAPWPRLLADNLEVSRILLGAACAEGVSRVVLASSVRAVTGHARGRPITTEDPVNPVDLYGVSKCAVEALGRYFAEQRALSVVSVRLGAVRSLDLSYPPSSVFDPEEYVDAAEAVEILRRSALVPGIRHAVVHAVGANRPSRFDLTGTTALLGFTPTRGWQDLPSSDRSSLLAGSPTRPASLG